METPTQNSKSEFITKEEFIKHTTAAEFHFNDIKIKNKIWIFNVKIPTENTVFKYLYEHKNTIKKEIKNIENYITETFKTLKFFTIEHLTFYCNSKMFYINLNFKGIPIIHANWEEIDEYECLRKMLNTHITHHESIKYLKEINQPGIRQWEDINSMVKTFLTELQHKILTSKLYIPSHNI